MTASFDLFANEPQALQLRLGPQAMVLRQRALPYAQQLFEGIQSALLQAPLCQLQTPGGHRMSVRTSSCGPQGWVSDERGYRYATAHPDTNKPWPSIPVAWQTLAIDAASEAGFNGFMPDSCLINQYTPESKMSLHQDRNESDFTQPIVSISLGMSAVFLWGGMQRSDRPSQVLLHHGDIVVWGGTDRLRFHGIKHLTGAPHSECGAMRYNLTLRRAR
ncbi:DNA oxidative demethylase AlkB [Lampropedia puyangensis]|uniref:DNA oxidative demethylase AlkB n=1 Tax=Lampropedia puyangensis TaxID=1330072 RepID=A0A4S8F1X0_9BURK|nr:DNA oxidative demethylase AlkB [Lampropedia puyangensis]THU01007.1 DNA oxidative demethylase AlkB [Lampropedia puyangensis]